MGSRLHIVAVIFTLSINSLTLDSRRDGFLSVSESLEKQFISWKRAFNILSSYNVWLLPPVHLVLLAVLWEMKKMRIVIKFRFASPLLNGNIHSAILLNSPEILIFKVRVMADRRELGRTFLGKVFYPKLQPSVVSNWQTAHIYIFCLNASPGRFRCWK